VGFELIGPVEGALACGTVGMGRMAEPRDILEQIVEIARNLKGEK
jgi:phosphopantothenoylcysteine synthetase/decarboxylase